MENQKSLLVILDGWGHGPKPSSSAITQADTPFVDSLYHKYPNAELVTFGEKVGLPEGQMGNSEVGHLNIGAGRVVYQELARINKAVRDRELHQNEVLLDALAYAKEMETAVHFIGLVSDGGVHSHHRHLMALSDITTDFGLQDVFIHAFTDGRDTAPTSGKGFIEEVLEHIEDQPTQLASVVGRYYAMDRDKRWERTKIAYDLLVEGKGESTKEVLQSIQQKYEAGETDEFLKPLLCVDEDGAALGTISENDVVLFFNFRTDRPRQLTQVLTQEDITEEGMHTLPLYFLSMTRYNEAYEGLHVLFTKDDISNTLGETLSRANKTQTRIAETEKYPHVTFFFNGGKEEPFEGEHRILIPSPKVATYDLQPEMSAKEVTDVIIDNIDKQQADFICLNYANADMVGHTGDFEAAKIAASTVDSCLKRLIDKALSHDYKAIVIADHGNADYMINEDGSPHTAHTTNLVPIFYINAQADGSIKDGKLGDIAPTLLHIMGIDIPEDMDGEVLVGGDE